MTEGASIHASAVLVGETALLIRGPSGAGKSTLVQELLELAAEGVLPFARLVADDRVLLSAAGGRLIVAPAPALAGMLEVRGFGVVRLGFEPQAVVGLVVDLDAADGCRVPALTRTSILDISLLRLPIAKGNVAVPIVRTALAVGLNGSNLSKDLPLALIDALRQ